MVTAAPSLWAGSTSAGPGEPVGAEHPQGGPGARISAPVPFRLLWGWGEEKRKQPDGEKEVSRRGVDQSIESVSCLRMGGHDGGRCVKVRGG